MDLSEYNLDTLRTYGEFVLCRGRLRIGSNSLPPSILVLKVRSEHPRTESVQMLEREHSLQSELDPSWAVRPIELMQYEGRSVLVLEDPGGEPLDQLIGTPMEMGQFLRVAISLSQAVRQLHGRGLVHKDLKPANVMIEPSTAQTRLTGFGIASLLTRERQSAEPPEFIAGTLPYMAPEQTGRMNRSIDSRSDLYALGVMLYEMLTGTLPFTASEPIEWVHCHIAKQPLAPAERRKDVPLIVSSIIAKLLAKTAEERYQTAAGLESDLRRCLANWDFDHRIGEFLPGEHDTPDRLMIPEKLYGREREVETLLASFERVVKSGSPELVLVSGYSGIGKSSVVHELHKALVPPRGLFASGKFDQYKRDIPYSTLAQTFQSLIRALLAKSEAGLNSWRGALREALGLNGQLIVDLVPQLKLIIGEQPPVPDLEPQDAQRRFQLVFRRFIGVFARPEHPLALFLDDLQWLDVATLDLLEDLLTRADLQNLMLIGAYRDNEVDSTHPLARKLEALKSAGARIEEITLAPLVGEHLTQLIADALRCEPEHAAPLAQLVHEKSGGNPFFAIQFITALAEERLLTFDHEAARWSWDLNRIHAKGYTENVVDLMVGKLGRLPVETQATLQHLACLGTAEIKILSIVHKTTEEQIHADLWEALRLELIVRLEDGYRFVHDRVQEAAYSLIPADLRPAAHLRIARLLVTRMPDQRTESIFEIVNQFNRGATLISSREEREQLAELNLIAGQRAKASSAYGSALAYFGAGAALLAEDCWERRHDLAFTLELNRAECEYVTGQLGAAEERLGTLATRAATLLEQADVAGLRVDLYHVLNQYDCAITVGLEYLRHLGIEWSAHPTDEEVRREYDLIFFQLGTRAIEDLIALPAMSNRERLASLDILTKLATPAGVVNINLHALVNCWAVNLSLECGNSDASCFAYVSVGIIAGNRFGDYQVGYRLGALGYKLAEHRGCTCFQPRVSMLFGGLIVPWTRPFKSSRDSLRRAFDVGSSIGDVIYAASSCIWMNANMLMAGDHLVDVESECERGVAFAEKTGFGQAVDTIAAQLGLVRTLRGLTRRFGSFDDEQFDEQHAECRFARNPNLQVAACSYWVRKLQARFLAGDGTAAFHASQQAERLLRVMGPQLDSAEYHFYSALSRAAIYDSALPNERQQHLEALTAHHRQLQVWAENCPENFENRAALISAEIARIEGHILDAEHLYEQAICSAHTNGFVHNEAVANEAAARFYAARELVQIAHLYMRNARGCYLRWGADGKVRQLDESYSYLREDLPIAGLMSTIGAPINHLDLATVLKISQAVSGEIVLENLVDGLLRTAVEHAGAERGVLILSQGAELLIHAEATAGGGSIAIALREAPISSAELPEPVVQYAARTQESVILDDASARGSFSNDEYIRRVRARSILCLPLVKQGRLIAVLYLENNLAANVFTPARIALLNALVSAAAISLENSRLYRELQKREAKIRRLVDANIVGVLITSLEGQILEANDAFLQMVRYTRDQLTSGHLRWTELTPPEWQGVTERALAQLRTSGTCGMFEKEYFRSDGSRVPVLVADTVIGDARSETVSFVLDLTERKRAEEERERLRQAKADLAYMSRVITVGELAASLAHEIKQPIAAAVLNARTCVRWLERASPDISEACEAASRVVRDSTRAADIVDRVRSLYRRGAPQRELVDLNEIIQEMMVLLQDKANRYSIPIRAELNPCLPKVMVDRVQLQQVVMNLMLNGIEAMADMGGELTVTSMKNENGQLMISVSDLGIGLPIEESERIFEAFFTTKPEGTGMGLSISRTIVESHGGRLWARPNSGRGTTFHFSLPIETKAFAVSSD